MAQRICSRRQLRVPPPLHDLLGIPLIIVYSLLLQALPRANAALQAMPHQADGLVSDIRSVVMFDEGDLVGPAKTDVCSSLDDGPSCPVFRSALWQRDPTTSADGVLPARVRKTAGIEKDWTSDVFRVFGSLVSSAFGETVVSKALPSPPKDPQRGSQCFRVDLTQLPPTDGLVHRNFSAGVPAELGLSWHGQWEIQAQPHWQAQCRSQVSIGQELCHRSRVVLRTALGSLRFEHPVILRRALIGIPSEVKPDDVPAWSQHVLICGRLRDSKGWRWCRNVADHLHYWQTSARDDGPNDGLLFEVRNSVLAVDEIVFLGVPPEGLQLALVEVLATLPGHTNQTKPSSRKVVLLRRSESKTHVEPVLVEFSQDAAMWSMNDVIRHNFRLRDANDQSGHRQFRSTRWGGWKPEFGSFEDMLQDLRTGRLDFPVGLGPDIIRDAIWSFFGLLRKSKGFAGDSFDQVVQRTIHDSRLDSLLTLQAYWLRSLSGRASSAGDKSEVPSAEDPDAAEPPVTSDVSLETGHISSAPSRQWVSVALQDFAEIRQEFLESTEKQRKEQQNEEEDTPSDYGMVMKRSKPADITQKLKELQSLAELLGDELGVSTASLQSLISKVTDLAGDVLSDEEEENDEEPAPTSTVHTRTIELKDGASLEEVMKAFARQAEETGDDDDSSEKEDSIEELLTKELGDDDDQTKKKPRVTVKVFSMNELKSGDDESGLMERIMAQMQNSGEEEVDLGQVEMDLESNTQVQDLLESMMRRMMSQNQGDEDDEGTEGDD